MNKILNKMILGLTVFFSLNFGFKPVDAAFRRKLGRRSARRDIIGLRVPRELIQGKKNKSLDNVEVKQDIQSFIRSLEKIKSVGIVIEYKYMNYNRKRVKVCLRKDKYDINHLPILNKIASECDKKSDKSVYKTFLIITSFTILSDKEVEPKINARFIVLSIKIKSKNKGLFQKIGSLSMNKRFNLLKLDTQTLKYTLNNTRWGGSKLNLVVGLAITALISTNIIFINLNPTIVEKTVTEIVKVIETVEVPVDKIIEQVKEVVLEVPVDRIKEVVKEVKVEVPVYEDCSIYTDKLSLCVDSLSKI